MQSYPLVSVIIPNYNHARFLDARIQSVLDQEYPNFEVIILDDNSIDNSLEIISKYKNHSRVREILVNKENSGSPFIQWGKGIQLAKGHYIWIAESDDYCEKSFLIKLVDLCVRNDLAYAFCRSKTIGMNDEEIPNHWQHGLKESFVMRGSDFIDKYLAYSCVVLNASSAIFSREIALEVSPDYQTYRGAGDWLFWLQMANKGKVAYLHEKLNSCRFHQTNTTAYENKNGNSFFEIKKVYDSILRKKIINRRLYDRVKYKTLYALYYGNYGNGNLDTEQKKRLMEEWGYNKFDALALFLKKCSIFLNFRFFQLKTLILSKKGE